MLDVGRKHAIAAEVDDLCWSMDANSMKKSTATVTDVDISITKMGGRQALQENLSTL